MGCGSICKITVPAAAHVPCFWPHFLVTNKTRNHRFSGPKIFMKEYQEKGVSVKKSKISHWLVSPAQRALTKFRPTKNIV